MSLEERWDKPKMPLSVAPKVPRAAQTASRSFVRRGTGSHRRRVGMTLTAQQMGKMYPKLISKRPELLNRLADRGVTYHIDPQLTKKTGYGGYYSPSQKQVVLQSGSEPLVAAHEITHAYQSTSPINLKRFITDKHYRAARSADTVMGGGLAGRGLTLGLLAYGRNKTDDLREWMNETVGRASYQSEVFAMGAGGAGGYPDLPVNYTEADHLFGGTFDPRFSAQTASQSFERRPVKYPGR